MNKLKYTLLAQLIGLYGLATPGEFNWQITYRENKVDYKVKLPFSAVSFKVDERPYTDEEFDPITNIVSLSFSRFNQ
jgi:hypothetical protein